MGSGGILELQEGLKRALDALFGRLGSSERGSGGLGMRFWRILESPRETSRRKSVSSQGSKCRVPACRRPGGMERSLFNIRRASGPRRVGSQLLFSQLVVTPSYIPPPGNFWDSNFSGYSEAITKLSPSHHQVVPGQ